MASLSRKELGRVFTNASRLLWVVASAYVPRDAVEDVLQDSFVTALDRLDQFVPGTHVTAWLAQIVRFAAMNHRRRIQRAPDWQYDCDQAQEDVARPPVNLRDGRLRAEQADFDDEVVRGLARIGEDARACLLLSAVMELPHAEISTTLGIAEGTVASHVHRARRALRESLRTNQRHPAGGRRPVLPPATTDR